MNKQEIKTQIELMQWVCDNMELLQEYKKELAEKDKIEIRLRSQVSELTDNNFDLKEKLEIALDYINQCECRCEDYPYKAEVLQKINQLDKDK